MESQEQIKEEEETSKWVVCPDSMMCKPESSKGLQQYAMHRDGKEEESYDLYRSSNSSQNPSSDVKPHNMVVNVKEESGENFGNNDISLPKNIFNKIVDSSQTKSCTEQKTIHLVKPESSKGNQQCDVHPGSKEQSDYLYRRYDPSQDRSNDVKPYNMVVNIKEESGESFGNNNIYLPKNTVSINRVNLGKREPRTEQKTTHLIETVHADKTYSCDICGRAFKKMLGLKRHKNSHGKKVINGKKYFVCNTCDFQVTSKKHFDLHMKTHSQTCKSEPPKGTPQYAIHFGSKEDQSDRVSKSYDPSHNPPSDVKPYGKVVNIKEKSATRFAKFHNGGIVFDCDICGCLFEDLENLRKHMNQHQNHATSVQEQFVCNLCDYKVERKKDFELHMKIHSIEKPVVNIKEKSATHFAKTNNGELVFDCGICGCSFDDLEIFCKHMNQHQNHATSVQEHFVCNLCDYKVERMKDFELHMKVHSIEKPFCCNICDYSFSEFGNLIKHMKTHPKRKKTHPKTKTINCDICPRQFATQESLSDHMETHFKEKPFSCNICEYKCLFISDLSIHMTTHFDKNDYVCNVCDYSCSKKQSLLEHMKAHPGKHFHCDLCDRSYTFQNSLQRHIKSHGGEKFYCDICNCSYPTPSLYRRHIKTHCGKKFYCDICNRSYPTQSLLKRHIRTHSAKKFHCKICNQAFLTMSSLDIHITSHTKEEIKGKAFSCSLCDCSFSKKKTFYEHMRTHPQKCFSCHICNGSYLTPLLLKRHLKTHSENLYYCNVCNQPFQNPTLFRKHVRNHNKGKTFSCNICAYRCYESNDLGRHMRTHSGEKPYSCDICKSSFSRKHGLICHMRRHTGEKPFVCHICGRSYRSTLASHLKTQHA